MLNKIKWYDWLIIAGIAIILLINPLIGQYIIKGIILAYEQLLLITDLTMTVGLTLVVVGFIASKVQTKKAYNYKLKAMKNTKTSKAGKYEG